ncbi:collagen alpha-1(VII) chain-like isoform X2 [Meles meles]|uniref:collagen alpha-1(VII) chain-like isoform X1 n=1 Tax=Meles meles TaxID=9662 RepID=UPI001E69D5DB|nr:collagen alpha-1(VII) chain-like isoform X1 [Meles meles]XP_045871032.1 collagen alpha-1(VII) chain-like isoform X2 [Meles meles]
MVPLGEGENLLENDVRRVTSAEAADLPPAMSEAVRVVMFSRRENATEDACHHAHGPENSPSDVTLRRRRSDRSPLRPQTRRVGRTGESGSGSGRRKPDGTGEDGVGAAGVAADVACGLWAPAGAVKVSSPGDPWGFRRAASLFGVKRPEAAPATDRRGSGATAGVCVRGRRVSGRRHGPRIRGHHRGRSASRPGTRSQEQRRRRTREGGRARRVRVPVDGPLALAGAAAAGHSREAGVGPGLGRGGRGGTRGPGPRGAPAAGRSREEAGRASGQRPGRRDGGGSARQTPQRRHARGGRRPRSPAEGTRVPPAPPFPADAPSRQPSRIRRAGGGGSASPRGTGPSAEPQEPRPPRTDTAATREHRRDRGTRSPARPPRDPRAAHKPAEAAPSTLRARPAPAGLRGRTPVSVDAAPHPAQRVLRGPGSRPWGRPASSRSLGVGADGPEASEPLSAPEKAA